MISESGNGGGWSNGYHDVFGHERTTKFCRYVTWNTDASQTEANHWLWGFSRHNEST